MKGIRTRASLVRALTAACIMPLVLAGCLTDGEVVEEPNDSVAADEFDVLLTGSVGDGPIVAAALRVSTKDGALLAELESDSSANYEVNVKTKGRDYPLVIDARGGLDLVTNATPDFVLTGTVLSPSKKAIANINPYSTVAMEMARDMAGGASKSNIEIAESIASTQLNFGLASLLEPGPISAEIGIDNIAEIVRASEALGELVRRTRDWLGTAGVNVSGDTVVQRIASDLVDGVLDGRGGPHSDARTAAFASVLAAQIALETMANELHVNGVDATPAMTNAIFQVSFTSATQSLSDLTATAQMLYQAKIGLSAAYAVAGDPVVEDLLGVASELREGLSPSLARGLLPEDYRLRFDRTLTTIATADDATLETANATVRSGDLTPDSNSAPTIGGTPGQNAVVGTQYVFEPTSFDPDGDTLRFSGVNLPGWLSLDGASGRLTGTPEANDVGTYGDLRLVVSDGMETAELGPFTITVDSASVANTPPTISGTPASNVTVGENYSFTPTANDLDGDVLTFSGVNLPGWLSLNATTGRLTGSPGVSDVGSYSDLRVVVSDGRASAELGPFAITVTEAPVVNTPPTIGGTPPDSVAAGDSYRFTPTVSDSDGDMLTFSVQNLPLWASFDSGTGTITGTPGNGDVNTYTGITLTVSDGQASDSLGPFSVTVVELGTYTATLSWNAPTENTDGSTLTDLAGYKLSWGKDGNLTESITIDNPGITSFMVENLTAGSWTFVSTAFNSKGIESDLSNKATKSVP